MVDSISRGEDTEAMSNINWCAYNESGIRIAVVMPFGTGYAVAGVYAGGGSAAYGGGLELLKFPTVKDAQDYVEFRNRTVQIRWEAMSIV